MRTFQFCDAKSHKFWNVEVAGTTLTVTYGKVGTAGQTSTKTFPTPERAQAEADKLVREKTGKGYMETTPTTASDAEAFERKLLDDPSDYVAWCAYADYLTERGDPRGEFMQVQLQLEDESLTKADRDGLRKREAALLKKHEREWLGPLAAVTLDGEKRDKWVGDKWVPGDESYVAHRFARGRLSRVEFHDLKVNQVRALAACPGARLLRELVVREVDAEAPVGTQVEYISSYYEPGPDVPAGLDPYDRPGMHALCRCPHLAAVRVFQLGEGAAGPDGIEEEYFNCHASGDLVHHVVKQMPNLEDLYLFAHRVDANKLFALPLPKLRVLQLYHSNSYPLDKLAANKTLTNLTTLLCHPHAKDYDDEEGAYIRLSHLRAVCRSKHLTNLSVLRLRLTNFGDAGVKEIVESGLLKRLTVLDLQGGCVTDEGARLLAAAPEAKKLASLNLSRNALSSLGIEALNAAGVRARTDAQHGEVPPFDEENVPEYLYEGDIE